MKHTLITAHSGCEDTSPDSMASVETALAIGADCAEVDVRLAPDGTLRLSHDRKDDYSRSVKLEEVFRAVRGTGMAVNCDIKEARALYRVLELAAGNDIGRDQLIFSGDVPAELMRMDPEIARRAQVYLNIENLFAMMIFPDPLNYERFTDRMTNHFGRIIGAAKHVGAEALNCHFKWLMDDMLDQLEDEALGVSLWTVGEEADLRRYLTRGVLNITSRSPMKALDLRKEIQG